MGAPPEGGGRELRLRQRHQVDSDQQVGMDAGGHQDGHGGAEQHRF